MVNIGDLLASMKVCSVTQRIKQVKQPRGGYINPRNLTSIPLGDGIESLNDEENVHASLVGLAVDYMTRFMSGDPVDDAFKISMMGASLIKEEKKAAKLMANVRGLDDNSIANAVKLSGFDVCFRAGGVGYKPVDGIAPDEATIENIRVMVERSLRFLKAYGPKVLDGITIEVGYNNMVSAGDGDFTTADTLWDFKVSKMPVKKENTLQLLMYWRMGLHSIHPEFLKIKYLGIYNPRVNVAYRVAVDDIPDDVIAEVEDKVIGY